VSLNTAKFHLKVIYRKLGVTSRAEAAARARQLMSR
jgi:LuxR family transcriptional regulator, maltose regulon positive regulatory protein